MLQSVLGVSVAVFGLVLFVAAGFSKLARPLLYQPIMHSYLGRPVSVWLVRLVGVVELVAGIALLLPATSTAAMWVCGVLLWCYAAMMTRQLIAGHRDMRCGCGGPASEIRVSNELVGRNIAVAMPFFTIAVSASVPPPESSLIEMGLGLALAVVLVISYHSVDHLIANRQLWQGAYS